jgi:sialate O-acetylesterase
MTSPPQHVPRRTLIPRKSLTLTSNKRIPVSQLFSSKFTSKRATAVLITALLLISQHSALAALKLPAIFGPHMVLQQDADLPVWGWASPGARVTVTCSGESASTTADTTGKWSLKLPKLKMQDEGQTLTIRSSSGDALSFEDVLIGEVWLASGQSNMQWTVIASDNAKEESAQANYPEIRYFEVKKEFAYEPQSELEGKWVICTPDTVKQFSAVGYFFGRHIHKKLNRPVGIIASSWGGTAAESWTSAEALETHLPEFSDEIEALTQLKKNKATAVANYKAALAELQDEFSKLYELEADLDAAAKWAAPELNDISWEQISIPTTWEEAGYKDLNGIVWFRKTVNIPASWAGRDLVLRPGTIDEVDVTWFNGKQVGARGNIKEKIVKYWNQARDYHVPGELVKPGLNVIAIRVIDATGPGGLRGDKAKPIYLAPADDTETERINLAGDWKLKPEYVLSQTPQNPITPKRPTLLYNQMIAPLIPYAIRGVAWYQGESNSSRPEQYRTLLPTMINDWRNRWDQGNFPFLIVQIANYLKREELPVESNWAELREAQALTATQLPNTGLAVTIDIGQARNIHPTNKQDVGTRLGLAAEAIAYGHNITYSGPTLKEMSVEGNQAILHFDHTGEGLISKSENIGGFAIRDADSEFVWADAKIQGNTIRLSAKNVKHPVAVRYAWANNPEAPIYNQEGLPMVPFRTDAPH